jgi:hypothetical protein
VGDIASATLLAPSIRSAGFNLYITRDIDAAKEYVRYRYADDEDARYALLASNKDRSLPQFGMRNDYPFRGISRITSGELRAACGCEEQVRSDEPVPS